MKNFTAQYVFEKAKTCLFIFDEKIYYYIKEQITDTKYKVCELIQLSTPSQYYFDFTIGEKELTIHSTINYHQQPDIIITYDKIKFKKIEL